MDVWPAYLAPQNIPSKTVLTLGNASFAFHQCKLVGKWSSAFENPCYPLHEAAKDTKGYRLGRGKSWMGQAEDSVLPADRAQANQRVRKVPKPIPTSLWSLRDTPARKLGKHCREWPADITEPEIKLLIQENSKLQDLVVYNPNT